MEPLYILFALPVLIALFTALFTWLWNITVPQVFGLKAITFWQGFRLLLLAGFLFGAGSLIHFNLGG